MSERSDDRGFTLIEVMVALAVLGIVLAAIFRIYGTGILSVGRGVDELRLALAAEAVLERTRLDLDPRQGHAEGNIDGIDWLMEARPVPLPPGSGRTPARTSDRTGAPGNIAQQQPQLWEVRVTVAAAGHSFELASVQWLSRP
ncbi:MAG TPA: prepilin-type N-terminal cleavage/methylation domain-containing protein [Geminicoccaceae bacterium]|nr:prepilin-type N-terminal cleavage/methylation domain-containing protein [Geminicoccus sp.]HMU50074.1 prepilin-type N-terminal cleavage/methylation domain-containing protein [Geminicoccaceae bacterium]